MKTIDIADLENVTGGAGKWQAIKGAWNVASKWGGRVLNWGGAGLQVADWLGGGDKKPAQPAQPATPGQ